MTAVREQIMLQLDARLQAIADANSGEYEREPSGDPTAWPAFSLIDDGHPAPVDGEQDTTRYAMTAIVEVFAEGSSGAAVSAQLNELHAAVVAAVMADPLYDGLVETIEEGALKRTTAMLADRPRKGFRQEFTLTFPTRRGNPASQ
jgi:hypothetical protein